jgi:uncharacterized protein (TIGR00730 family)
MNNSPSATDDTPAGSDSVDAAVTALLDALGDNGRGALARQLVEATAGLLADAPARLDLKIAAAALLEMGEAFEMFQPFKQQRKVSIFGSARTAADDPLYAAARSVAEHFAAADWMVVTGAGPGIMQAGMEGAGRERSIGVSIRLPFEQGANPVIAGDEKYVSMKYFFTRKLMLIKESQGFVCLPGGFGTLDEVFELLTLTQTGKGLPVPIVFLDTPGDPYWESVHEFIDAQLVKRKLVSPADTSLYLITDDCAVAAREVLDFYRNYQSIRYVGDRLIIRMRTGPTDQQLSSLNDRFGHLCTKGAIERTSPLGPEVDESDGVDLQRVALRFAQHGYGDLRNLINEVNSWG